MSAVVSEVILGPSIGFVYDDGGRSTSKRSRQSNDCAIRAIAIACGLPYDDVYNDFAVMGRKSGQRSKKTWREQFLHRRGAKRTTYPAVKGESRMTLGAFIAAHQKGRYVLSIAKHLTCVVDSVLHDTSMLRMDACVYMSYAVAESADQRPAKKPMFYMDHRGSRG